MMDETFVQMRDFMLLTENLITADLIAADLEPLMETPQPEPPTSDAVLEDLRNAIFKMRGFMESREGDLGLGVELGMQRAADMIENIIKRYETPPGD
jgi:hypothetical protein